MLPKYAVEVKHPRPVHTPPRTVLARRVAAFVVRSVALVTPSLGRRSTLGAMRFLVRALRRMVVTTVVAAVVVAVTRAVMGRVAGDPGAPAPARGSFDTWPTVPTAAHRPAPNGSHVTAEG